MCTFCLTNPIYAWDFGAKAGIQHTTTDNVNSTATAPISDSYNTLTGYIQEKNDEFRLRLKGKYDKYAKQTENNNYVADLSLQYKRTKMNDYTFSVFKQVYNGTPIDTTGSTSDNNGGKISTTFNHEYDKDTTGYITIDGTLKNYSKIAGRKDKIFSGTLGLEDYFTSSFMANPEFSLSSNSSSNSYYKTISFGPSLMLSFTPNDTWEFYYNGSLSHTKYSGRTVVTIVKGKSSTKEVYQELISNDFGAIYYLTKNVPFQFKYSTSKNTSNDGTSKYKSHGVTFDIGAKF